jgi:hypothetical protein
VREPSIRCTVVDPAGTTTFVGPAHLAKVLTAACSRDPRDVRDLLSTAERYDASLARDLAAGLAIFDEHNTPTQHDWLDARLAERTDYPLPVRVVDAASRELSQRPEGAGLVLFNLTARRIVQVQNSYAELLRQDRGRVREDGEPTDRIFHYRLPDSWALMP